MRIFNRIELLAAMAALSLVGCKEDISDELNPIGWGSVETKNYEFKVSDVQSLGINILDGQSVSVFSTDAPDDNRQFVFTESTFTGEAATTGSLFALYPYTANATFTYKDSLPVIKTAVPKDLSLEREVLSSKADSEDENLEVTDLAVGRFMEDGVKFQTVYTDLSFNVTSEYAYHIDSIRISGNNNEKLSGKADIEVTDSIPFVTFADNANSKVVYKCNIDLEKNQTENLSMSIIPTNFTKGFKIEFFNGTAAKEVVYEAMDVKYEQDNVIADAVLKAPEYYIEYSSPSEIVLTGYLSEYSDGYGKIYFDTPEVPAGLFQNQTSVTEIVVPAEITSVGDNAFAGTTSLESVEFGNIEFTYDATETEKVTSVISDSQLETLGNDVFSGSKVSTIVLPGTIKDISGSFNGITTEYTVYCLSAVPPTTNGQSFSEQLKYMFVPEANVEDYRNTLVTWYQKIFAIGGDTSETPSVGTDYYIMYKKATALTKVPEGYIHKFENGTGYIYFNEPIVPASFMQGLQISVDEMSFVGIERIGQQAFGSLSDTKRNTINKLVFDNNLKYIEKQAFNQVTGLTGELKLPNSLVEVYEQAFRNTNYTKVVFGDTYMNEDGSITDRNTNLKKIWSSFEGCNYINQPVVIPSSVTDMFKPFPAALGSAGNKLVLYCLPVTPPTGLSANDFNANLKTLEIYVPAESVEAYKATAWSKWADKIKPITVSINN